MLLIQLSAFFLIFFNSIWKCTSVEKFRIFIFPRKQLKLLLQKQTNKNDPLKKKKQKERKKREKGRFICL